MAGFYIHVPFCKSKCIYCDFYSIVDDKRIEEYVNTVLLEIDSLSKKHPDKHIETIYFGGGTPAVLPSPYIKAIVDKIKSCFCCGLEEVTLEINPSLDLNLSDYKACGIGRLSFGVQSLSDDLLKWLGRRHNAQEAIETLCNARALGYNVSADLLLGIPNSTCEDIKKAIDILAPIVDHVSAYILKVEEGTRLDRLVKEGKAIMPQDDDVADAYDFAVRELEEHGIMQYEISNFSKVGKESKHNLKYWTLDDYIGVGPSAHSLVDGRRYYNTPSLVDYLKGMHSGNSQEIVEDDSDIVGVDEYVMLALRLTKGVDIDYCNKKFGVDLLDRYKKGLKKLDGIVSVDDGFLKISKDKFLLQNNILLMLFDR